MAAKGWFEQFLTETPRWIAWPYILSYPCCLVACRIDEFNFLLLPVAILAAYQMVKQNKLNAKEIYYSVLVNYAAAFMYMEFYGRDAYSYFFEFTSLFILSNAFFSIFAYVSVVLFNKKYNFNMKNIFFVLMLNLSISPSYAMCANVLGFLRMMIFDGQYRGSY